LAEAVTDRLATSQLGTAGPRIAFLHGLFGQGRNWTGVAKALSQDFRVTLVDLPNHGLSPWTEDVGYLGMAEAVANIFAEQDQAGTVVGHSMGGKVAMTLALRRPELVERLCVVDIAPVSYRQFSNFVDYVRGMRALSLPGLSRRADAEAQLAPYVPDASVRSFLLQNLRRDRDTDGWRWQLNLSLLADRLDQLADWPAMTAPPYPGPVLWLRGSRSSYVRSEYAAGMRALFPRAQLLTVKNAGHWVHAEQPETFVQVVRRFARPEGQAQV
jgi:pimeloyl-ACP methyl ester carboxylesterase